MAPEPLVIERPDSTDVVLDADLDSFFTEVADSGRQAALMTSSTARLSPFVDLELRHTETTWILQDPDGGHRDAVTGSPVGDLRYATGPRLVPDSTPTAVGTADGLVVEAITRFRATSGVQLGAVASRILRTLDVEPMQTWGRREPLLHPWSFEAVTEAARASMPDGVLLRAQGAAFAWIGVRRTERGLSESTRVLVPPRALTTSPEGAVEAVTKVLTSQFQVELATVFAAPTPTDGWRLPGRVPPSTPVALVLGPRGIRAAGLPGAFPDDVESEFVGRPRIPSQLLRFTDRSTAWRRLVGLRLPTDAAAG